MKKLSDEITRKFVDVVNVDDEWSILSDTGWKPIEDIKQTVEYTVWVLELANSKILECADNHIVFLSDYREIFVKDLKLTDVILTVDGPVQVKSVIETNVSENMYDIGVDSDEHRYYSNGILSHNTTCAAGYILWRAMFMPDQTILIAAHKFSGAQEIMQRIRFGYELCDNFIRSGVVNYNKGSIDFENGSRIVSATTTENTGRGMSISLLYCLDGATTVTVRNKNTKLVEDISLAELYQKCNFVAKIQHQYQAKNNDYEILTPNGWESFDSVILNKNVNKSSKTLYFKDDTSITATNQHRFFISGVETKVDQLVVGDYIDSIDGVNEIIEIHNTTLTDTYDIFNAKNHVIVANSLLSHNCDEFSAISPSIATDFWVSISPTLATGGKCIITSTPNHDDDMFATIWKDSQKTFDEYGNLSADGTGVNGFYGIMVKWDQHPERDEAWARQERAKIGDEKFRREHCLEFISYSETLINAIKLKDLEGIDPLFKIGQVRWYKKPSKDFVYLLAIDPCMGTGGDYAAIQVFEFPSFIQVAEWQHNTTPIPQQIRLFRDIMRYIQGEIGEENTKSIYWSCENNAVGESALVIIQDLGEDTFPGCFISEPAKKGHVKKFRKGFNTTFNSKLSTCSRLKYLIEEDKMKLSSRALISELKHFIANGMSFKARYGQNDDLVSAVLLVIRISVVLAEWDPKMFELLSVNSDVDMEWDMPLPIFVSMY